MGTYTYSRTYKIIVSILCGFLLAIGAFAEILILFTPRSIEETMFFSILYITLILAGLYGLNHTFSQIIIDGEGVRFKSLLYKRVFLREEVTTITFTDNGLKLYRTEGTLPLAISSFRQGYDAILALLNKWKPTGKHQQHSIASLVGKTRAAQITAEKKQAKLRQSGNWLMYLYLPGLVIAFLMLITRYHIKGLAYLQFLLVFVLIYTFIHFRKTLPDNYTLIGGGLLLMFLLGGSLGLYQGPGHLFDWHPVFMVSVILSMSIFLPYAMVVLMASKTYITLVLAFGCVLIFGCYGIVSYTNSVMDNAVATKYPTRIIAKYIEKGGRGGPTYYITCSAWEGLTSPLKVTVSKSYYFKVVEGQETTVAVKPGKLNIPWFQLEGE